jgi:hypothetical protein
MISLFTSAQAEQMCKDRPPKPIAVSVQKTFASGCHSSGVRKAPAAARIPPGPCVNYEDLPESSLIGGSGPLSRRVGYRSDRAKFRMKSLVPPIVPEALEEDDGVVLWSQQHLVPWSCSVCTFLNSDEQEVCEMCAAPVPSIVTIESEASWENISAPPIISDRPLPTAMQNDEWPSLQEAIDSFVDCEVSSMGSSWLDVDGVTGVDDGDIHVVNPLKQTPKSWAARAKAVASHGPAATIPAAGVVAPPWQKAQTRKQDTAKQVESVDDNNWELDCLEERRLWYGARR